MSDPKRSNKQKLFSPSNQHQSFSDIKRIFEERKKAIRHFCECDDVSYWLEFSPKTAEELVEKFLADHLLEAEYDACLTLFGAIEAAFRMDLFVRHKKRGKDPRSKAVRQMLKNVPRGGFDKDIDLDKIFGLLATDPSVSNSKQTINLLVVFFKYRNWLAHGRYWVLEKLGILKPPTFDEIYQLAEEIKIVLRES